MGKRSATMTLFMNNVNHIKPVLRENDPSDSAIIVCPVDELTLTQTVSVTEIKTVLVTVVNVLMSLKNGKNQNK